MTLVPVLAGLKEKNPSSSVSPKPGMSTVKVKKRRHSAGCALHKVLQFISSSQDELVSIQLLPSNLPTDIAAKQHGDEATLVVFMMHTQQGMTWP